MRKKKKRQRQWQTQIQKFSAAADGKAGADERNSNTPYKCKNGISITWNDWFLEDQELFEGMAKYFGKNANFANDKMCCWAIMHKRTYEISKYSNKECRNEQISTNEKMWNVHVCK